MLCKDIPLFVSSVWTGALTLRSALYHKYRWHLDFCILDPHGSLAHPSCNKPELATLICGILWFVAMSGLTSGRNMQAPALGGIARARRLATSGACPRMSRQCAVAMCQATCAGFAAIPGVKFALALCDAAAFFGLGGQTLVRPQGITPSAALIKQDEPCFECWCDTLTFCGGISTHVSADIWSLVFGCGRFCPWVI